MKGFFIAGVLIVAGACRDGSHDQVLPEVRALSPQGARHLAPSYSPDGKRIAYWTPATPAWQLWVANADMSSAQKLPVTGTIAPAQWSPDGSRLVVTSSHTVVVPVAGGEAKRVTTGSGIDFAIGWFADGDRVAYAILTAEDGGGVTSFATSLTTGATRPLVAGEKRVYLGTPSPDGAHIAFTAFEGSKSTIWVADSAGKNARPLTTEGFESQSQRSNRLSWSPDGREILYESRRTGTSDLWIVSIAGGARRQLTHDVRNDYAGVWSADSKWIAFLSDRGRQTDIWMVSATGGEETRVTDSRDAESNLVWRPGTNELAFVTTTQTSGIWSIDLASGNERRLSPDTVRTVGFWGSPDGSQISYVIDRGAGVQDLVIVPVAGGAARTIVSEGGTVEEVRWAPDGKKIAYVSDRGGSQDVWTVDLSGTPARQMTRWPGFESSVVWSSDGRRLYFVSDYDSRFGDVWSVPTGGGEPTRVTRNGTMVGTLIGSAGVADLFATSISAKGNKVSIVRLKPDGKMTTIWDRSNANVTAISPTGDSITALVEQPNGAHQPMIIPALGGKPRAILTPNDRVTFWSKNGRTIVYTSMIDAIGDIGIFSVADGAMRRLTATPESETGAEITPDGKTVLTNRTALVQRILTVDLSSLINRRKQAMRSTP